MKKLLLVTVLAFCLGFIPATVTAQSMSFDRPLIWGSSPFQDSLWAIDTSTWSIAYRIGPSLPGYTITGINGMAQDPITDSVFVILKVSGVSGRVLAKMSLPSGVCASVTPMTTTGNLGDNFASLTFDAYGQLYGATGDGATVPETFYKINKYNAVKTLQFAMGNGADGEIVTYNKQDSSFYHWSGNGTVVMEKWFYTNASYTPTNVVYSGTPGGETFGVFYNDGNKFIVSNISSQLIRLSSSGVYSPGSIHNNPDDLRGLVMLPYFNISDDTICQNESITLTGGGHQLYDNFIYHWGDGNSDTIATVDGVLTVGSHTYTAAGNFTVNVETDNGFGGDTVYAFTIQVNNIPVVSISGFATVCSGDSVTLTASSGGTSQWYMNGVLIPGATTNVYSTDQPGVYNMIKTNLNGCSDSAAVGTTVIVSANPVVALGNDTAGCSMHTVDAGNAGSTFLWSNGDTTQMVMVMMTANLTVTVTNTDGCSAMDTINVTIYMPPAVDLGPDTTACDMAMIDGTSTPGSSYLWCTGATTPSVIFTVSGSCALMVTDTNGCVGMDTINVTINPSPVFTLGPDVQSCTNVVVYADTNMMGGSYLWCDSSTANYYWFMNSGTCDVTYTDTNGCTWSDTITVTIYGLPTVTATASSMTPCADDADVVLTGTPAGGMFTGTSVTGNNFDPSVGAGTYSIIYSYSDVNGCSNSDTISITVNACVGIAENNSTAVKMFPNPTTGILNLLLPENNSVVEVYDVLGNTVSSQKFNTAGNAQIDLSNQPNGVYFVRVNSNTVQRVVLQK